MSLDLFKHLPREIIIGILSGLHIKTILICKCVCKSWFDLIESPEFSKLHLSKSPTGLAISQGVSCPKTNMLLEFVDERRPINCSRYYNKLFRFDFPYYSDLHSSVNGLIFIYNLDLWRPRDLYICNPITREYFEIPPPWNEFSFGRTFGFGVSKTGQYKVVMVFRLYNGPPENEACTECEIYTLGKGSWRSIQLDNPLRYEGNVAAFLNGNLHWLASDSKRRPLISCFDLETELFSTFSSPPNREDPNFWGFSTLRGCLCMCDNLDNEMVIWLMKEYGDGKSWTKEYIIKKPAHTALYLEEFDFPIKVFEDGDILITDKVRLIYYSNKDRTIKDTDPFGSYNFSRRSAILYTPSFLSLEMFAVENVKLL